MVRTVKLIRKPKYENRDELRYRVALFSDAGMYPRGTICLPDALFHADADIVFAVTHGHRWHAMNKDLPYSEVAWMDPELIRLLGSMILAERPWDNLQTRFHPIAHSDFTLNEDVVDLENPRTAQAVKNALLNTIGNRLWPDYRQKFWTKYQQHEEFVLFEPNELCLEAIPLAWKAIRTDQHLVVRGLHSLVKSDMLGHYPEFQEEGAIATYIALDASFQLVLRLLRAAGNPNPSAKDAGRWVYETFDEPLDAHSGMDIRYFEEFYDQRVQTVHPASRFGDLPFAPIMIDDRIHLRQELPSVFAYMVLGGLSPHYKQRIHDYKDQESRRLGALRQ
jgi:hypothetical protein